MADHNGRVLPPADIFARLRDLHEMAWQAPHDIAAAFEGADDDLDPNLEMEHSVRPLHLAAISPMLRAPEGVTALLEAGADPDLDDGLGAPPVFWAARWGEASTLAELMVKTTDPVQRLDGWSRGIAHWWAIGSDDEGGSGEQVLLEAGADFLKLDDLGAAPIHWAAGIGGRVERLLAIDPTMAELPDWKGFRPIHYAAGAGITLAACKPLLAAGADPGQAAGQFRPTDLLPAEMKADWNAVVGEREDAVPVGGPT